MGKVLLVGDFDYIQGHLRYGHSQVEVDEEFVKNSTKQQLKEYLDINGEIIVDDYEIEDKGDLGEMRIV